MESEEDWTTINEQVSFNRNDQLGSHGAVFHGRFADSSGDQISVAVKLFRRDERTIREPRYLRDLKHTNIVKMYIWGICWLPPYDSYFVMELCDRNLWQLMADDKEHCRVNCRKIFKKIIKGLMYLHGENIIHRDVHPGNILVNRGGEIVIAGFNLSKKCDNVFAAAPISTDFFGSFGAPEKISNRGASAMGDLYSAGRILLWLITGRDPTSEIIKDTTGKILLDELDHVGPDFHHDYELAKDLIRNLLKRDPDDRITSHDALNHAFFFTDERKTEFIQKLYTSVEHLPNKINESADKKKGRKTKKERKNVKQHLNEPVVGIIGKDWSTKLKLTDEEMETCGFIRREREKSEEAWQKTNKIQEAQRFAIYQFAQTTLDHDKIGSGKEISHSELQFQTSTEKDSNSDSQFHAQSSNSQHATGARLPFQSGGGGKITPYIFDSPFSLLRLVRNMTMHRQRNNKYIKTVLDKIGEWKYIHARFPKFFLFVWSVVMRGPFYEVDHLRKQFRKYEDKEETTGNSERQKRRGNLRKSRPSQACVPNNPAPTLLLQKEMINKFDSISDEPAALDNNPGSAHLQGTEIQALGRRGNEAVFHHEFSSNPKKETAKPPGTPMGHQSPSMSNLHRQQLQDSIISRENNGDAECQLPPEMTSQVAGHHQTFLMACRSRNQLNLISEEAESLQTCVEQRSEKESDESTDEECMEAGGGASCQNLKVSILIFSLHPLKHQFNSWSPSE